MALLNPDRDFDVLARAGMARITAARPNLFQDRPNWPLHRRPEA